MSKCVYNFQIAGYVCCELLLANNFKFVRALLQCDCVIPMEIKFIRTIVLMNGKTKPWRVNRVACVQVIGLI